MPDALTYLLRTAAPQLIATAVEAELASDLPQFTDVRTGTGHAAVLHNGHHPARPFQTSLGLVNIGSFKVRSKDGTPVAFRSALVPPYVRRSKSLDAALPWLCLKGVSRGDEPPHLNWSTVIFRKRRTKNDKQASKARRDCLEVTAS